MSETKKKNLSVSHFDALIYTKKYKNIFLALILYTRHMSNTAFTFQ